MTDEEDRIFAPTDSQDLLVRCRVCANWRKRALFVLRVSADERDELCTNCFDKGYRIDAFGKVDQLIKDQPVFDILDAEWAKDP